MNRNHPLVQYLRSEMAEQSDPEVAVTMQAYMKTDQPFYGIKAKPRKAIFSAGFKLYPIDTREDYQAVIQELWQGQHREEMYQALEVAERCKVFRDRDSWDLYEILIRSATNWDTLDWIVRRLISPIVRVNRELEAELIKWREDANFWVRRASLLAHLKHKDETNIELLAETILMLAHEDEFFIRKAIGWILREYSYTDAKWVEDFVLLHEEKLSGLSKREALKAIVRSRNSAA